MTPPVTPIGGPRADPPTPGVVRRHVTLVARLLGAGALLLVGVLIATWDGDARLDGKPRHNVAHLARTEHGLHVAEQQVWIPRGLPTSTAGALEYRDVFFLGRRGPKGPRDVYWWSVRFSPAGVPLATRALVNLSQTRHNDESRLVAAGRFVAFPIRVQDRLASIVVADVRGESRRLTAGWSRLRRLTNGITNYQETGHWRAYNRHALEPRRRVGALRLAWRGGKLEVRAQAAGRALEARFDPERGQLLSGADWLTYQPPLKTQKGLVNWAVNTVRNLSFVGAKRMEKLQYFVYWLRDLFRRGVGEGQRDGQRPDAGDAKLAHGLYRQRRGQISAPGWPPRPIAPVMPNPTPNEGRWFAPPPEDVRYNPGAPVPLLETFIHPDPARPYAVAAVVVWDPRQVDLGMVGGTKQPESSTGLRGWGRIPRDGRLDRLIAAFNGGFQTIHGEWGMQVDDRLIREPARWAATVMRMTDGALGFGTWDRRGKRVPRAIRSFRQNLTAVVEDGVINPLRNRYWGFVPQSEREKMYIVRSGICLTKEGFGAYIWGNALSLQTLGKTMLMARCQYGMQLDINSVNASMELYKVTRRRDVRGPLPKTFATGGRESYGPVPGAPDRLFRGRLLLPGMYYKVFPRFIRHDWRDFFYLILRNILPGKPIPPVIGAGRPGEGKWRVDPRLQGPQPFPPRLATTSIRPDPGRPEAVVQLVKLAPRRLGFRWLANPETDAPPQGTIAYLSFAGGETLPGLAVGGQTVVSPKPGLAVVVGPRAAGESALARLVTLPLPAQVPAPRLLVAGPPLAVNTDPGAAPRGRRASALGVDRQGFLCYAVTEARWAPSLHAALKLAGCARAVRLPDRERHGPLLLRGRGGERFGVVPGDRPPKRLDRPALAITAQAFAFARRVSVGVAARPKTVRFWASKRLKKKIEQRKARAAMRHATPGAPK